MTETTPAYACECGHALLFHRLLRQGEDGPDAAECVFPGCACEGYERVPAGPWDFEGTEDDYYNPDPGPEPEDDAP